MTNCVSTPGSVGRKNGAFSGAFDGSFGLFRCCNSRLKSLQLNGQLVLLTCITSRFSSVCHRERGRRVSVTSSPSNCGGVEKTSTGASGVVSAARPSMTTNMLDNLYRQGDR